MSYFASSSMTGDDYSNPRSHIKNRKYGTDEPTDFDGRGGEIPRHQGKLPPQTDDAPRHPLLQAQREAVLLRQGRTEAWMKNIRVASQRNSTVRRKSISSTEPNGRSWQASTNTSTVSGQKRSEVRSIPRRWHCITISVRGEPPAMEHAVRLPYGNHLRKAVDDQAEHLQGTPASRGTGADRVPGRQRHP